MSLTDVFKNVDNTSITINDKRLIIDQEENVIIHNDTKFKYDPMLFGSTFLGSILGEDYNNMSIAYLYGLMVTGIKIPPLVAMAGGLKFKYLNSTLANSDPKPFDSVIALYPKNGIVPNGSDGNPALVYVAYCSGYIVNLNGDLFKAESGTLVTRSNDQSDPWVYKLKPDNGETIDYKISDIVTLSFGLYDATNYLEEPIFLDINPISSALENWIKDYTVGEPLETRGEPDALIED